MAALMIMVPDDTARMLSEIKVEGKPEPDKHITVIHLGKNVEVEDLSAIIPVLYEITEDFKPFPVKVNRITTFPGGDDGVPVICPIISDELHKFHKAMKGALDDYGFEYSNTYPDYKPHVTLSYDPNTKAKYDIEIHEIQWSVSGVVLWGSDRGTGHLVIEFPFSLPSVSMHAAMVKLAMWSR
jgi:2'-5' RNA ligase